MPGSLGICEGNVDILRRAAPVGGGCPGGLIVR